MIITRRTPRVPKTALAGVALEISLPRFKPSMATFNAERRALRPFDCCDVGSMVETSRGRWERAVRDEGCEEERPLGVSGFFFHRLCHCKLGPKRVRATLWADFGPYAIDRSVESPTNPVEVGNTSCQSTGGGVPPPSSHPPNNGCPTRLRGRRRSRKVLTRSI